MKKLSIEERRKQIIELISINGTVKTSELAEKLGVSSETIRRDLNALTENGEINRWLGNAVVHKNDFGIYPISSRLENNKEEKIRICKEAISLIENDSVFFLDTGSTVLHFANLIKDKEFTIITNSLPVVNTLFDTKNRIIFTGGYINTKVSCSYGPETISFLQSVRVDAAIMGTSGFERHNGPTTNNFEDLDVKQHAINCAKKTFVLSDSSKATYSSMLKYAKWSDIDVLITSQETNKNIIESLSKSTKVIQV
ncbi:DeoR/GlpR family DNA-binding transcription regulator [Catenisphaera adipataccumulans]|jgi:DeoR/GlpR family transcriptional regulator of sugar metabolism|uniref:DeoR/GlpR family transcriptional regulator of sugar metabolism n=1 Tax=Catenisphaera adipataccumulans TaxID=700500 RepID=A0A7W8FVZ6_9FIRM|nr:DeoR/GlpR family DNA-binding transcription regulator [Catenisphaera adipataccumulans]MBB5182741.1 DeoR/GlpR family transcriptional regulator of sugar metabolism [Catenisphaera adipataccumulans]